MLSYFYTLYFKDQSVQECTQTVFKIRQYSRSIPEYRDHHISTSGGEVITVTVEFLRVAQQSRETEMVSCSV